jgi:hypothetical protein
MMAYSEVTALAEIAAKSIPRRAFLTPMVYTLMLRTRYNSPSGVKYHQPVWQQLGAKVQPYINKSPEVVQKAVRFVLQWFTGRR